MFVNEQQIPSHRAQLAPEESTPSVFSRVYLMPVSFCVHHVGDFRLNVILMAFLRASDISVSHEDNGIVMEVNDTVDYISAVVDPCQDNIAFLWLGRFLQDNAVFTTDDEWQHASSVDREGNADAVFDQFDGLLDNLVLLSFSL